MWTNLAGILLCIRGWFMCLVQFDKFFTISKVCEHNDTMGLNWPCKIDLPRHEWHNHVFSPVTLSGFINTLYNAYVVSVTICFHFPFCGCLLLYARLRKYTMIVQFLGVVHADSLCRCA